MQIVRLKVKDIVYNNSITKLRSLYFGNAKYNTYLVRLTCVHTFTCQIQTTNHKYENARHKVTRAKIDYRNERTRENHPF